MGLGFLCENRARVAVYAMRFLLEGFAVGMASVVEVVHIVGIKSRRI